MEDLKVFCDGGARGNPGPGGVGIVIKEQGTRNKEQTSERIGKFVGLNVTNNQAEYLAVIEGLKAAEKYKPKKIEFFLDSQLIVRQLNGSYKIKNMGLKKLWARVQKLMKRYRLVTFNYIPREKNKEADGLVGETLKSYL